MAPVPITARGGLLTMAYPTLQTRLSRQSGFRRDVWPRTKDVSFVELVASSNNFPVNLRESGSVAMYDFRRWSLGMCRL